MSIKKDESILEIMSDFETLSKVVLESLDFMEQFIISGQLTIPEDVLSKIKENEKDINKMEVKLSDKIVNTIVLQQPMASEIRKLMSCYRILINIERIGDRIINVTEFIKKIKSPELYQAFHEVYSNTVMLSFKMVRRSILCFIQNDVELAIWTIKNDTVVDELNEKLLKKLVKKADGEEANKQLLVSVITMKEMMSNFERIGDYATNIAEAAIYAIEGRDLRHKKLEDE